MSEIETLTGEDTTERVEMALGKPITSREKQTGLGPGACFLKKFLP